MRLVGSSSFFNDSFLAHLSPLFLSRRSHRDFFSSSWEIFLSYNVVLSMYVESTLTFTFIL
jgi:hypothetical protein